MELTLDEALQQGIEAHKAGQIQEAERLYTAILKAQPKHPDANHNMGVLAVDVGKIQEALAYFKIALEVNPSIGQYWLSYIDALIKLDRITDAKAVCDQAKDKGVKSDVFDQLEKRLFEFIVNKSQSQDPDPSSEQLQPIISLYTQGQLQNALSETTQMLERFPNSVVLYNIAGACNAGLMQFDAAIACYTEALKIEPNYADAYNNMGVALKDKDDLKAAIDSFKKAVKIKPDYAEAYYNMGNALKNKGDLEAAIESFKEALKIKPDYAEALSKMGVTLNDKGDSEAAIESYKKALKIKPDYADAYYNMGNALKDKGDLEAAIESYKKALKIKPDYADAYNDMGIALNDKGDSEAAIESFKQALKIKPDYVDAYNNTGNVLKNKGDLEAAIESFKQALKIKPDYAEAYNNMGVALTDKGELSAALYSYKEALKIKPDYAEAYFNIGVALQDKGNLTAAIDSYKQAIKIEPDYAEAFHNMSDVNLSLQNFKVGWSLYEWRWKIKTVFSNPLQSSKPLWKPSKKQRVLLWCEQGVGDEIMFASLIPDLYSSTSKLIVLTDKRLIPLFRRSFPDDIDFRPSNEVVSETEYDSQIPMGSVPLYFRQSIDSFKNSAQGWLSASSVKAKNLRSQLLADDTEILIGISWHSTASRKSKARSKAIPLNKIAPFLHSSKVKLVSLQYGDVDHEINKLLIDFGIKVIQVPEIDNMNNIDGLAALISACDEVVSIDNVTAHLAGSLGKQSKILLTSSCNWNWGQGQQNSYWYNSMRLYRQTKIGDWEHVIKQL